MPRCSRGASRRSGSPGPGCCLRPNARQIACSRSSEVDGPPDSYAALKVACDLVAMQMLRRHKLVIAAAAVIAAASAGGAYAATQTASNPRQAFVNDMAKRLRVSPSQLTSAFKAALIDRLDTMVKAG